MYSSRMGFKRVLRCVVRADLRSCGVNCNELVKFGF